jgi:Protein-tyrosine-phosphatase-like, N-terminal domain
MEPNGSDALEVIADRLEAVLPETLTSGAIKRTVRRVWDELAHNATCTAFLPLLTERIARERLRTCAYGDARLHHAVRGRARSAQFEACTAELRTLSVTV